MVNLDNRPDHPLSRLSLHRNVVEDLLVAIGLGYAIDVLIAVTAVDDLIHLVGTVGDEWTPAVSGHTIVGIGVDVESSVAAPAAIGGVHEQNELGADLVELQCSLTRVHIGGGSVVEGADDAVAWLLGPEAAAVARVVVQVHA